MGAGEGHAIIGGDRERQAEVLEGVLKYGKRELLLRPCQGLAAQEVAGGVMVSG